MSRTVADLLDRPNDVRAVHGVEIDIQQDGLVVWINIDGVCALRVLTHGMIPIKINDHRKEP